MKNAGVVIITGASSGIGRACAQHLAGRGYRIYGTSRRPASEAPSESKTNPHLEPQFTMVQMDVESDASVERALSWIVAREGRVDAIVNNAGISLAGAVEETSVAEAKALFETNFFGVLRVCLEAIPIMRRQGGGTIVNISSLAGLAAVPFQAIYSASKYALEGLSEAMRMEVRPFGIRVVLIEPGDYRTEITANRGRSDASRNDSVYLARFERALEIMEESELGGPAPEEVALLLEKILANGAPRLRYATGPASERLGILLKRFVPAQVFEWGIMKYYRLH